MRAHPFALCTLFLCCLTAQVAAEETVELRLLGEDNAPIVVDEAETTTDTPQPDVNQTVEENSINTAPEKPLCEPKTTPCAAPRPNWYFEVKPGYYYFTNRSMRQFFGTGGFTIRGEAGYRLWGPLDLWFDGGYFHKDGHALGGPEHTKLLLATLSLGLKAIWYPHERVAFYLGAAPRLFLMMLDNDSPYVRSNDNEIGIGGAFNGGIWFFPIPGWKNFFFDLFADYSLKTMKVDPDEISSDDYDVNISGLSAGLGLGIRF